MMAFINLSPLGWTTRDEIDYLRGLGRHVPMAVGDRLALLEAYLLAMSQRVEWGHINPSEVRIYVDREIAAERRRRRSMDAMMVQVQGATCQ